MNLPWNHILLACLLTVLEIYGTEAILSIPYSTGPGSRDRRRTGTQHKTFEDVSHSAMQVACDGESFLMLTPYGTAPQFSFTLVPQQEKAATDGILFKVQQPDGTMCAVLYKETQFIVKGDLMRETLTIKSAMQTDNVEIMIYMNDVRQVINGIESQSAVPFSRHGADWVLEIPQPAKLSLRYRVGTYPAGPTPSGNVLSRLWKSSRRWNFTPIGHMLTADFSCSTSMPVEFFCPNDHCNYINYRAAPNTVDMTVLAYVVPNNSGGYRLMKGNRKTAPTDLLCTLYVESAALEIQFPGRRKRHINVAHLGTDEVRSGRGFRVYMNGLQWHAHEEEEEEEQN